MNLKYYGHACFSLTFSDGTVLVIDPFDKSITYPPCGATCNAALLSHHHHDHDAIETLNGDFSVIDTSGQYTVGGVRISAMPTWHDHHCGARRGANLMFRVEGDGVSIAHLGDLGHKPDAEQAEFLSGLDVLLIPVGGHYTIDHTEAAEIIDQLNPRVAIAMHYRTEANSNFDAMDIAPFAAATNAKKLPNTQEFTPETIGTIPAIAYMDYQ